MLNARIQDDDGDCLRYNKFTEIGMVSSELYQMSSGIFIFCQETFVTLNNLKLTKTKSTVSTRNMTVDNCLRN